MFAVACSTPVMGRRDIAHSFDRHEQPHGCHLGLGSLAELITSLTRADALRLRSHWQGRVVAAGEVQIGRANKCGHVSTMFRAINESKQLNLPSLFERVRIRGGKDNQRVVLPPPIRRDSRENHRWQSSVPDD
jgi:hypothetical protein